MEDLLFYMLGADAILQKEPVLYEAEQTAVMERDACLIHVLTLSNMLQQTKKN